MLSVSAERVLGSVRDESSLRRHGGGLRFNGLDRKMQGGKGMKLYLDMDGVLADFDLGYERAFGVRSSKLLDNVDWQAVRNIPNFYRDLPPMADLDILWSFAKKFSPTVLTGVPSSVDEAPSNKIAWVKKHLGNDIPIICCRSSEKCNYAKPGDVLVDDWEKYRHKWEGVGGIWVTHINAEMSVAALSSVLKR